MPAVFSHTSQIHNSIKHLITEQICHKLILSEGKAKQSRVKSTMRWWTKCISMGITKTASRNIAAKAGKTSEAVLDAQARFVITDRINPAMNCLDLDISLCISTTHLILSWFLA